MKLSELEKINLNIFNGTNEFFISKFNKNSNVSTFLANQMSEVDVDLFIFSEIKGSLDIEGDGSSRKIITDLIKGKRKPQSTNERKALNLYNAYNFILSTKPSFTKQNLMTIYSILTTDIDLGENSLESNSEYRQSKEDGFIGEFKTPLVENLNIGMNQLFEFINSDLLENQVLEKALLIQIIFIFFHPFYDFNGRSGRLLTFWYLVNNNQEHLAKVSLLSLPANKKEYIKIWVSFRKTNNYDLTFFMNWLGHLTIYSARKILDIINDSKKNGISLSETEILILFYLLDIEDYILANDLMAKIDLGITKQGFFNAIESLSNKNLIYKKISANKIQVKSKKSVLPENKLHKELYKKFITSSNDHSITFNE